MAMGLVKGIRKMNIIQSNEILIHWLRNQVIDRSPEKLNDFDKWTSDINSDPKNAERKLVLAIAASAGCQEWPNCVH